MHAANVCAAHGPQYLNNYEAREFAFENSRALRRAGTATCVAWAQRGQYPASAPRAEPFFVPGWARAQDSSRRPKIDPSPSREPERISAPRHAVTEYSNCASVVTPGGNPACPFAVIYATVSLTNVSRASGRVEFSGDAFCAH